MCLIIACALRLSNTFVIWKYNRKKKTFIFHMHPHKVIKRHNHLYEKLVPSQAPKAQQTFSAHLRTILVISTTTMSTHLIEGCLSFSICRLTMVSNAMSGVKSPVLRKEDYTNSTNRRLYTCLWLESTCTFILLFANITSYSCEF